MPDPNNNIDSAPVESNLDEIVEFEDTENTVYYGPPTTSEIYAQDPYEDQNLETVLSRPWIIRSTVWNSTDTGELFTVMPLMELLQNGYNAEKLSGFQYIRSDIEIEVRVNSTLMHAGLLLFSYNLMHISYPNLHNQTTLPSYIVSANEQTTLKFTIPFAYPIDWWLASGPNDDYQPLLTCSVLSPLTSTASVSAVDVVVFARFVKPRVAGMITVQSEMGMDNIDVSEFDSSPNLIVESYNSNAVRNISRLVKYDKPTANQTLPALKPYTVSPISVVHGVDTSVKLSLDPEMSSYDHHNQYGDACDMTDFSNYIRLPYLIGDTSFDSTFLPGDQVLAMGVTPIMYDNVDPNLFALSPVCAVASQFRYWKGAMKYCFIFVCNTFVSARVAISWQPKLIPAGNNLFPAERVTKVFDIKGTTKVCFSIPYLQKNPWLKTSPDNYNGSFSINVINRATTTSTELSSSVIHAIGFCSGGESMTFSRPNEVLNLGTASAQSASYDGLNDLHELFRRPFDPLIPSDETQVLGVENAEVINSWIDLNRRFTCFNNIVNPRSFFSFYYAAGMSDALLFVRSAFLYKKGSIRYKVKSTNAPDGYYTFKVNIAQRLRSGEQNGSLDGNLNAHMIQDCHINQWMEVETPFYSDVHFASPKDQLEPPGIYCNLAPEQVYAALGEDFSMGFPIPPNRIVPTG